MKTISQDLLDEVTRRLAAEFQPEQAAEKAIKGFLAFRGHDLDRTHDLRRIIQVIYETLADQGSGPCVSSRLLTRALSRLPVKRFSG